MQHYMSRLIFSAWLCLACSSLVLKSSQSSTQPPDPHPVESRIKHDKSDFEEKERQRVAHEVQAEKKKKKQVRRQYFIIQINQL